MLTSLVVRRVNASPHAPGTRPSVRTPRLNTTALTARFTFRSSSNTIKKKRARSCQNLSPWCPAPIPDARNPKRKLWTRKVRLLYTMVAVATNANPPHPPPRPCFHDFEQRKAASSMTSTSCHCFFPRFSSDPLSPLSPLKQPKTQTKQNTSLAGSVSTTPAKTCCGRAFVPAGYVRLGIPAETVKTTKKSVTTF